jgi:tetratricopeptide (TPR) repeat protein
LAKAELREYFKVCSILLLHNPQPSHLDLKILSSYKDFIERRCQSQFEDVRLTITVPSYASSFMDSIFFQQRLDRLREHILDIQALQKQSQRELQLAAGDPAAEAHFKEQIKGLNRQLEEPCRECEALTQQLASIEPESFKSMASQQLADIENNIKRLQSEQTALLGNPQSAPPSENSAANSPDHNQSPPETDLQAKLNSLRERIKSLGAPIEADPNPKNQLEPKSANLTPPPRQTAEKRVEDKRPDFLPRVEPTQSAPVAQPEEPLQILPRVEPTQSAPVAKAVEEPLKPVQPPQPPAENLPQKLTAPPEKNPAELEPAVALRDTPREQTNGLINGQRQTPHRPIWQNINRLLGGLAFFVILVPIGVKLSIDLQTSLQQKEAEKTCNQALTQTGDRKQDFLAAKSILDACTDMTSRDPNNVSAWNNAGRASLLTWVSEADDKTKKALIDQTREHFRQAVEKSGKQDPQALFYWKFMDDFEEFTSKAQDKSKRNFQCDMKASERYKEALEIYNPPGNASEKPYKISQGDEFILLELSHFLINRDVVSQNAIDLLNNILKANPDPDYKNKILKNIWLSKAGAENRVNRYDQVRDSLLKALKYDPTSYKILQDLGGAYAQLAVSSSSQNKEQDRELAIKSYQKVTQNSDTANSYRAWRNLSFLLYLQGRYPEAVQTFDKTVTFKLALSEDDQENEGLIRDYREAAIACNTGGNCPQEKKDALEKELRDRKLFSNYFITHDLIETEVKDPFFDVEHDLFYKCQK